MIISPAPFRVSPFGGGSNYATWYRRHGSEVIGFAINKYCSISPRPLIPFFDYRHRIAYPKVETVNDAAAIQHPAVRHVLQELNIDSRVEIHHDADLPARSGLGSSSSFTVGLLHALHAQAGRRQSKDRLALPALNMNRNVIKERECRLPGPELGACGMDRIDFPRDGSFSVSRVIMPGAGVPSCSGT